MDVVSDMKRLLGLDRYAIAAQSRCCGIRIVNRAYIRRSRIITDENGGITIDSEQKCFSESFELLLDKI